MTRQGVQRRPFIFLTAPIQARPTYQWQSEVNLRYWIDRHLISPLSYQFVKALPSYSRPICWGDWMSLLRYSNGPVRRQNVLICPRYALGPPD